MSHLIIADDNEPLRAAVAAILDAAGHRVIAECDVHGVLGALNTRRADILLIDIAMPGAEGLEAITAVQRQFPHLRIIAMSGAPFGGIYLDLARRLGAPRTLAKPFDADSLFAAIADTEDRPARAS